jgi:hypothetical protein
MNMTMLNEEGLAVALRVVSDRNSAIVSED